MSLPLLLAGPILRRVEPTRVAVWLALSSASSVRLRVWEGRAESGRPDPFLESPETPTLRVGRKLHVALVSVSVPEASGQAMLPDALYSYDIEVTSDGQSRTLVDLGMLARGVRDGVVHLPLGYEDGLLPSFALPPSRLEDLNLLYGSCRRPGHPGPDALAMVDDLIEAEDAYKDPRARPHQLFLGGDQIYADDVTTLQMLLVMELAEELIGRVGPDPLLVESIEHVRVDSVLRKVDETTVVDPTNPALAYRLDKTPTDLPLNRATFPEDRRLSTTQRDAQFTSGDGHNHVLGIGEFSALYLTSWSNAVWGSEVTGVRFAPDPSRTADSRPIGWDEKLPPTGSLVMAPVIFPDTIAGNLYVPRTERDKPPPSEGDRQAQLRRGFAVMQEFRRTLPKVRRAMANVSTYMIFDDHDVTDDFFLSPLWRRRVLGTALGQTILRNAMTTYALFQDWGNDPVKWQSGSPAELLELVPKLFPEGAEAGPNADAANELARRFGHHLQNAPVGNGRYGAVTPAIPWHFGVDGPKHHVIALDNRTRRSYGSEQGPPGNVSIDAMVDQIPQPPLPAGREILVVIAPLQVIGPPILDEIVAPLLYRVMDLVGAVKEDSELHPSSTTGLREMLGTDPDAIEAWAFDTPTYEHLLARLAPYERVVLLSGDVHYSSGTLMSYWRGDATRPARFAQFTSSGFKNVMPDKITYVDRSAGFAQQMIRANLGIERVFWEQPAEDLVLLPAGSSEDDLVPVMRARFHDVPVGLPTWGWPDLSQPGSPPLPEQVTRLNPAKPPDWRWRVRPLLDSRPDRERPPAVWLLDLQEDKVDADLARPETVLEGYAAIATRHQHAMERLRNARQMLFRSNVGRVRFLRPDGGGLDAVHEVYTTFADPDEAAPLDPKPEAFVVQVAPLGPADEEPPAQLRRYALVSPDG